VACDKLLLKPGTNRAYWRQVDVGLTLGEYELVHLLALNAGSFVTYRSLYEGECPIGEHASYARLDGLGCVPVAKARGQSRRAAKALLAINAECGANELARRRNWDQGLVSGVQAPSCRQSSSGP
jgi:hypothetical protein